MHKTLTLIDCTPVVKSPATMPASDKAAGKSQAPCNTRSTKQQMIQQNTLVLVFHGTPESSASLKRAEVVANHQTTTAYSMSLSLKLARIGLRRSGAARCAIQCLGWLVCEQSVTHSIATNLNTTMVRAQQHQVETLEAVSGQSPSSWTRPDLWCGPLGSSGVDHACELASRPSVALAFMAKNRKLSSASGRATTPVATRTHS
mmetsp:Transcript_12213/g.39076  ORF Transcript_12213/g.39076 Transcript_12213/m.39076 type:complete len:203 (-) Transcript_12213:2156-2764(-)